LKGIAFTIADNPRSGLILSNPAHCLHSIPSHPRLSPMKDSRNTALPRWAWLTVCLLAPVALLNYLDRQMLAAMKSSVMADLPDIGSEANWGRMLGQFKWVYAFLSPVGGYLADRFGKRVTICGSLCAWSLVTWWTAGSSGAIGTVSKNTMT
jgi:MFS family permease